MPASLSIVMVFSLSVSTTQPPCTGVAAPVSVVPRPRVVTGTPCRLASSRTTPTSDGCLTRITATGRYGIFALSNDAATSEAASVATTREPRRRFSAAVAVANDFMNPTEMNLAPPVCKRTPLGPEIGLQTHQNGFLFRARETLLLLTAWSGGNL